MRNYLGYISDLDGTLCDTLPANIAAYSAAFEDAGLIFDENEYKENFGLRYDEMIATLAPTATADQATLIAERKQIHYKESLSLIKANISLIDLLFSLKSQGAKIALATTARKENASAVLQYLKIDSLFDVAIFGEDVKLGKPNPECYIIASERLSIAATDCLVFEDSDIGIAAAQSAGASTLRITL